MRKTFFEQWYHRHWFSSLPILLDLFSSYFLDTPTQTENGLQKYLWVVETLNHQHAGSNNTATVKILPWFSHAIQKYPGRNQREAAFAIIFLQYVREEGYNDCYCQEWEISTQHSQNKKRYKSFHWGCTFSKGTLLYLNGTY